MAPNGAAKRKQPADEEILSVETASSSLSRATVNKRPRVSSKVKGNAVNDIESEVFTEIQSDNDEYAETESGDRGAEAFDYATQRDADLDEDQDDQVDDGRAVQHARERVSRFDENHAADNAIIEEVQCTNFMCHSRLTIELGPLINFIIGHNGSGKSAVLTALQLCLGGKTTVTNRGNKLADFIKQGTESGSLSVRIKNQGPSAYNADIYGPSIIVERWFTKNGTSGFKIKNSQGRIISTKKQDLEEILDAFALQLDNPMMCLTQDMAREFLNNSTPNHKYKFFMKGTQLETLDSDYKIMSDMLEELELRIDILEGDEKVVHKAYNDAKEKVKRSDENQGLADQHRILLRQMAWCQVEDQEKDLAKIENKIVERKAKIEQVKQKAEEASTAYDEANEASEQATAEAQALAGQIEPINEEKKIASEQLTQQKQEVAKIKAEERGIRSDISAAKKRKAKLENDIALEQQRIADANGGLHAAKLAEWQAAKDEADRLKAEFDDHSRGFRDLEAAKKDAEQAAKDAFPKIQVKRDDLGKCQDKIQLIESRRGQWLTAYGKNWRNLRTLLNLIEKEKARFTDKPIGPMGSFVRILKPEWTSIVERTFGGAFNAFLCTNKRDQGILSQLMKEAQYELPSYIIRKTPIETTANEPDASLLTLLRALEFDNDLARNSAIINQAAEQCVLIQNRSEAYAFMFPRDEPRPRNVRATVCMHDTKRNCGQRFTARGNGGHALDPVPAWDGLSRMKTDNDYELREEQAQLQTLNRQLKDLEDHTRNLQTAAKEAREALARHLRDGKNLKVAAQAAQDQADKLKDELESLTVQPAALDALEQQLRDTTDAENNAENQFGGAFEELERATTELTSRLNACRKLDKRLEELGEDQSRLERIAADAAKRRGDALLQKNGAVHSVEDAEADLESEEAKKTAQENVVTDWIRQASLVSTRVQVPSGQNFDSLERSLTRIHNRLNTADKELGGTRVELLRLRDDARSNYRAAAARRKYTDKICRTLKNSRRQRIERWQLFRKLITVRSKTQFMYLLTNRSFRGNIKMDHREKTLDIQVEPDITKSSDKGRQTKTLSGGEKSYSTICLLLALWDAMGSPIRCLDEFDVFMDSVNRDVSMKMMIEAARQSISKQFILISPQSVNASHLGNDVSIIKMNDPERGQQPLPLQFTRERR